MSKVKITVVVFGILLVLTAVLVSANGGHQSEIEEGRQLVESEVSCDELNNEQLEAIGEYYMELMHPGEAHEAMHEMMGIEEGTEYHEQFHVNIAKMMYCGEGGMMGSGMMSGGMMGMMPMMNMMGIQIPQASMMQGMMGMGYGYWNFVDVLYVILLIGLVILVYLWIVKLWKNTHKKTKK